MKQCACWQHTHLGCCSSCAAVCATGELDLRLVFLLVAGFWGDRLSAESPGFVEERPLFDMREWGGGTSGTSSSGIISGLGFDDSSILQFLCVCVCVCVYVDISLFLLFTHLFIFFCPCQSPNDILDSPVAL